MKTAYPIILTPNEGGYLVYAPDFNINTEGRDLADAMEMAADAISLCGITLAGLLCPAEVRGGGNCCLCSGGF